MTRGTPAPTLPGDLVNSKGPWAHSQTTELRLWVGPPNGHLKPDFQAVLMDLAAWDPGPGYGGEDALRAGGQTALAEGSR